jgi:4-hydroxy-tetrahydrodipicolinate reductase
MNKIALIGSSGRMGQEILKILSEEKVSVTEFDKKNKLSAKKLKAHSAVIEFSSLEGFEEALAACVEAKIPFVSGTTGLEEKHFAHLEKAAKKIPVLWASNMSLGVALLKKAIQLLSGLDGFDYQIEEFHHNKKKDKPSGTAITLQESLNAALNKKQKAGLAEPVSIRAGGIVGIHKVYAISDSEMLCFEHQAMSRKIFAEGSVKAARWLVKQKPGLYKIEDILNGE